MNKITVTLIAVLFLLTGGSAFYFISENNRLASDVDTISAEISSFEESIGKKLDTVDAGITALGGSLSDYAASMDDKLGDLNQHVEANASGIRAAGEQITDAEAGIDQLQSEIRDVVGSINADRSKIQADKIYEQVINSVVVISDGTNTIGSGFVYDNRGRIITANHVAEVLDDIFVVFADGRAARASLVGSSSQADVAVLQLDEDMDVSPVSMADSSKLTIGEAVITVGSPFGLEGTVTSGIISQLNRAESIDGSALTSNLIQFDAAANFGNSGGPLFNVEGEVAGLIIARIGPESGEGVSYAVSANKVKVVAEAIIENGKWLSPLLGVAGTDITPLTAEELGLDNVNGILVGDVQPGGPAEDAGIVAGDIIVSIDGRPMNMISDLTSYLQEYTAPGQTIDIIIDRDGFQISLEATLTSG